MKNADSILSLIMGGLVIVAVGIYLFGGEDSDSLLISVILAVNVLDLLSTILSRNGKNDS